MEAGAVLGGRYRITGRLGRGGMGEVWAADDIGLRRRVAVKILPAGEGASPALGGRLRREAENAARLQHPGITVVHDIGEHDGAPFFVMELLDGVDLGTVLAENPQGLPVERAVETGAAVADALAYAHRAGVVHRDIKPANLMEPASGGVKICDFGISWSVDATLTGGWAGTPAYMAPEQYEGGPADARTDLYAFGCTLYALLTGAPPFGGGTPPELMRRHLTLAPVPPSRRRTGIPAELDRLVLALLAKNPADRPASAEDVARWLRASAALPPTQVEPIVPGAPPSATVPPARAGHAAKGPGRRTLIGCGLAVGAFAVYGTWMEWRSLASQPSSTMLIGHTDDVQSVRFAPDGKTLASVSKDDTVRVWDVAAQSTIAGFHVDPFAVHAVEFSPDGRLLAVIDGDGTVSLRDAATRRVAGSLERAGDQVAALAFSPDGRSIAVGTSGSTSHDGPTVRLWDVADRRAAATFKDAGDDVESLAFSPDGRTLAAGGQELRLWDVASRRRITGFDAQGEGVAEVAFSPDGKTLASRGGNEVRLWDVARKRVVHSFDDAGKSIFSIAYSPDGRHLAAGDAGGTTWVWDLTSGKHVLKEKTEKVLSVAFSPDGKTLASGHGDERVRLWRVR